MDNFISPDLVDTQLSVVPLKHRPIGRSSKRTSDMHGQVRKVLQHHGLTVHGDGVVEADLIEAVLDSLAASEQASVTSLVGEFK